ncbi:type ISP restriction/modification enzyme [Hugenholtzia roseola]|uniref:type ISP restriction/modification enzyme n=1 Tax=Hugenholtzia roseola TaxID=1002 RepID=UPI00040D74F1|nr:type ISP restriction/modification enzyme [Hugenholtzia roseola]
MSIQKINEYYRKVAEIPAFGGKKKESSIRRYFADLLSFYAENKKLRLIDEFAIKNTSRIADGGLVAEGHFVVGYWEAKDLGDKLEKEIEKKIKDGYPTFNILFEDSNTAVLYQDDQRETCDMLDAKALHTIITKFVNYESQEARSFKEALSKFTQDVPEIIQVLQNMMQNLEKNNETEFIQKRKNFHELCKVCINPHILLGDINEMIIQHILTEDIFKNVFADTQFHEENNIAQSLIAIEKTFFIGEFKREIVQKMRPYYEVIKDHASGLHTHVEKQNFLKYLYEEFYKAYNPKNADKLGIVYTPSEVVNFMIKATDFLLEKHFDKSLIDENVHILDPATGTGTFITDLLEYLPALDVEKFKKKYKNEIHANEVAILPYYIAYLNIEYTYQRKVGTYHTFDNLCWVDTLDNVEVLKYAGKQTGMFGNLAENAQRIKAQNDHKISVIIGNPPYNANQQNENDNNKNREYKELDKRIKDTFIKESTAQKTKLYDMYARFYRWAMDRIDKNGVIAFITNRSFIDSRTFDGFRKIVQREFDEIYILDTKSDVRQNPKIAGTTHNIFGIQAGVAIMFLIKKETNAEKKAKIFYYTLTDEMRKEEKLDWLRANDFEKIPFERIRPDEKGNWLNISKSDFEELIPVCNKEGKLGKEGENTIFELYSLGVVTSRDDWSYDFDKKQLEAKAKFFIDFFHQEKERWKQSDKTQSSNDFVNRNIKWTSELEAHLVKFAELEEELAYLQSLPPNGKREKIRKMKEVLQKYLNFKYNRKNITTSLYRPFVKKYFYFDKIYTHRIYQNSKIFGFKNQFENKVIGFRCVSAEQLVVLGANKVFDLSYLKMGNGGTQCLPLYRYENGERKENITDWALALFQKEYKDEKISKLAIFHYVYAVLHKPAYRKKYEIDLKRDFPRIPLYENFWQWAHWGEKLMELHLHYETLPLDKVAKVNRKPLETLLPKRKKTETDIFDNNKIALEDQKLLQKIKPDIKLRVKDGVIEIDELTSISNIAPEVWEYKLGNRTAVEWVLNQYKPSKSRDESIAAHFDTYDFFAYKEEVIELLLKVIYLSVETVRLVRSLE